MRASQYLARDSVEPFRILCIRKSTLVFDKSIQNPAMQPLATEGLSIYSFSSPDSPSTLSPPMQARAMQVATELLYHVSVLFGERVGTAFLGVCLINLCEVQSSVSASHVFACPVLKQASSYQDAN